VVMFVFAKVAFVTEEQWITHI